MLGAKAYLNEILKGCPHLDEDDVRAIRIPYLQIMGFQAVLFVLYTKDKDVHIAEEVYEFDFPATKKQIRTVHVENLDKALSLLKELLKNLEDLIEEGKFYHEEDKMVSIINELSEKKIKNNDQWLGKVKLPSEVDEKDGNSDDHDDDENEY
ncbi:uncharacterized protein BYT42DRAFT_548984 [Radiomyces spectabilis]|uniref:uncharacterized protein n=1 Tax=Radiomyces spectabilis TaxID=64574 RepID=UPI00221F4E85|nr:uncharacterized protein BYT42DRAFT_548984 [Radiomyces spectabilis]KAI8369261.1 hypothetical protein BYT42DRAFT_548984 [Radiomyces spectabilis]